MIWFGKSFIKFCKSFITLIKLVSTRTCSSARVRSMSIENFSRQQGNKGVGLDIWKLWDCFGIVNDSYQEILHQLQWYCCARAVQIGPTTSSMHIWMDIRAGQHQDQSRPGQPVQSTLINRWSAQIQLPSRASHSADTLQDSPPSSTHLSGLVCSWHWKGNLHPLLHPPAVLPLSARPLARYTLSDRLNFSPKSAVFKMENKNICLWF